MFPSCSIRSARARPAIAPTPRGASSSEVNVSVLRGNQGEVATLVGVEAEVRGVESIGAGSEPRRARARGRLATSASSRPSPAPVDHVSDGERVLRVANGHELLASVTGTGCMSSAITGCFLAAKRDAAARGRRRGAGRLRRRRPRMRRADATGPGLVPRRSLRRARGARPGHARRAHEDLVKLHAIVDELETARLAVEGGATVVQWRLKDVAARRRRRARPRDAEPLRALRRDVRRQRRRRGCARCSAPTASTSAAATTARSVRRTTASCSASPPRTSTRRVTPTERADYIGVGPVWATPSKPDADPADRARRAAGDLRSGRDAGGRDRRHRRDQRRGLHSRGRGGRRSHPGGPRRGRASRRRSMKLSELGRARPARRARAARPRARDRARRGAARRRRRRHAGRARRGRPLPARLDLVARPRLACGGGQPQRPRGLGSGRRGAARLARRAGRRRASTTSLELYEGIARDRGPRHRRRHDSTREQLVLSVTAIGRSERVPGRAGARPGDAARRDRPARRGRRRVSPRVVRRGRRFGWPRGRELARARARDARHLRRARGRRRPHRVAVRLPGRDRARTRAARRRSRAGRPRLRRGLRAARGGREPEPASASSDAARKARASS